MGPVGGRRFGGSVKFADGKNAKRRGQISAAEFPQQKKTRVFGVNRPLGPLGPIHTKDAQKFCRGNFAADISKSHTFKWDRLADAVLEAA